MSVTAPAAPDTQLDLESVTLRYGAFTAVEDVSLTFSAGALVGLIGANGAGKTSLLRACAGLIAPDAGQIRLGGRPLAAWPRAERARVIGYLAQDRSLQWPLTVARVVALGRLPYLGPWDRLGAADAAIIADALAKADVAAFAQRPVTHLSGGEVTRVLIARLLAGTPKILLADEPISGLDPAHQLRVLEIFRSLAREGHTVVAVLHDLTLAARFCDRLVLMNNGRVAADGAPADVLTPPLLARCYGITAHIGVQDGALMVVPWERKTS